MLIDKKKIKLRDVIFIKKALAMRRRKNIMKYLDCMINPCWDTGKKKPITSSA